MTKEGSRNEMELTEKAKHNVDGKTTNQAELNNEKAILLEKRRRVSAKTAVKLRLAAVVVSWISAIVAFILGVSAITFAWVYDSQSLFGFGIDALLDCISSIIILWRFHSGDTIYSDEKEMRACIAIGVLFLVSSAVLAGKSIAAIIQQEHSERPRVVFILAAVNGVVCLALGIAKVLIGYRLESRALVTDSITTLVGALMSVFTVVFSVLYSSSKRYWYLDDAFGILCAVFLLCYGIRVLVVSVIDLRKLKTVN